MVDSAESHCGGKAKCSGEAEGMKEGQDARMRSCAPSEKICPICSMLEPML